MPDSIAALITTTEKNKKMLEQLVISLCNQTKTVEKLVIIFDGQHRPDKQSFDDCPIPITWIDNPKKESLTSLQNQAISFMKEDFVLLLNDDVVLEDDFTAELLSAIEKDEKVGMSCGKLLRMDGKTIDTAGQMLGRKRTPIERGYGKEDKGQFDNPEYVFGSCGAAVLLRKKMLEDCAIYEDEFLDNQYNMFYEDLDLSWRAANFGWKAFYTPQAVAFHERGATSKEKKPVFEFLRAYNFAWLNTGLKSDLIKNRLMTIIKNDSFGGYMSNIIPIFIYEFKIFFYCLIFDPKITINTFLNIPLILTAFKKRSILKKKMKAGKR